MSTEPKPLIAAVEAGPLLPTDPVTPPPPAPPPAPTTDPTTTTTTTTTPPDTTTGGGSGPTTIDDQFAVQAANSLIGLITNATSQDALEAQSIILRRIALEGDVVPSRIPPPRNITEIGGYLNLLDTLGATDMRAQALAGILGVAGPNPPLGWVSSATPLSFASIANDRPEGAIQATLPVTVAIRSDFAAALTAALQSVRAQGCLVPLAGGPSWLPSASMNGTSPADALPYLGRVLTVASAAACVDATTDALALVRLQGATEPFALAARASGPAAATVPPKAYEAIQCTATACAPVTLAAATFVALAPVLATAGFYPPSPLPAPTTAADAAWARLTNVTGLVAGTTNLGDELSLLYAWSDIAQSVFADAVNWTWNGTAFAP